MDPRNCWLSFACLVGPGNVAAREKVLHGAPRFVHAFSLHGNALDQAAVRVGYAVGIGEGCAGQGEEQGGGKDQLHSSLDTRLGATVCSYALGVAAKWPQLSLGKVADSA